MRKFLFPLTVIGIALISFLVFYQNFLPPRNAAIRMHIKSTAFTDGNRIPSQYTCDGENTNPPLTFADVPKEARSLALVVDDPDAPGGTWIHWLLWNISPRAEGI